MNLHEFLTHPDVQLPAQWGAHGDFEAFVRGRLDNFLTLVDQLDPNAVSDEVQRRRSCVVTCCESIRLALRASFEGHPHEAYLHFDVALQAILPEIEHLAFRVDGPNTLRVLYRVRQSQASHLQPVDLFHIPFELRHLVATQRYSIPGLPCLYLAGSLYTCWEEMGRPPFHELQCAALWVKRGKTMKMLNFSNRPARLALSAPPGIVPADHRFLSAHIVLWPLVFSSSIKVKHRNAPFKPEYVIPQMVLQWVTQNHGFDGLAYFSTHVRAVSKTDPLPACNVVYPAKVVTAAGRCERLCDTFKMTAPYGWQLISSINVGHGTRGVMMPLYDFEFAEGIEEPYQNTEFGIVEMKLSRLVSRTFEINDSSDPTLGDISPV